MGKLFPGPAYKCDTWSCRKVTHGCTMTLCSFPFQLVEIWLMNAMRKDQGSNLPVLVKIVDYSSALGFVVYDFATERPPGIGTTALVVIACLAEVLLIAIEAYTSGLFSISNGLRRPNFQMRWRQVSPPPAQMRQGTETLPFASSATLVVDSRPDPRAGGGFGGGGFGKDPAQGGFGGGFGQPLP